MDSASLVVGNYYAFRAKRAPGVPFLKVKLLALVGRGGKIKVRYEEGPHPGLEEYVSTRQLIVRWGARRDFLRDEERAERIKGHERRYPVDRARSEAVGAVLESTGEPSAYVAGAVFSMPEKDMERLMRRAGVTEKPVQLHPLGFIDRHGIIHLPFEGAETLARAFAAAEPETVLIYIQDQEDEMKQKGYVPGERIYHQLLREYGPGFALARQWAGFDREVEQLQKEIARLRGLVSGAVWALKRAGEEREARRLERALEGG